MTDPGDGPSIALTMGDPAGVGPEIIIKFLAAASLAVRRQIVVVGNSEVFERAAVAAGPGVLFHEYGNSGANPHSTALIDPFDAPPMAPLGQPSAEGGAAAFRCIERALSWVSEDSDRVLVTAPINKEALHLAGHSYPGHTEILAELSHSGPPHMLLSSPRLKAIHVTTHQPLGKALAALDREGVLAAIAAGDEHLRELGARQPRIAVAGLNPHAGEGGIFGREEIDHVVPAVEEARRRGFDVEGPLSPDTLFFRANEGEFDLIVALYHDQGHIPIKLVAFHEAVNVTLGLAIRRTSVDHGTAFDIAGSGRASPVNLEAAVQYARDWSEKRKAATK